MPKERNQAMKDDPDVFWMIRDKTSGKFAHGGVYRVFWSKTGGKVWPTHKRLMAHLIRIENERERQRLGPRYRRLSSAEREKLAANPLPSHPYQNAEIVQFRRTQEAVIDAMEYGK